MGHSLRMVTSGDMLGHRLYILLKSHSSFCCLLINLNFELLNSLSAKSVLAGEKFVATYSIST
jgi:hypothetical protein